MSADVRFWDNIAERYANQPIADESAYQEKLARTRALLTPQSEVLEFACGTGGTALAHAPFVRHLTAIDCSDGMLDYAREKLNRSGLSNVHFERSTIETFEAPSAHYDVVLGMSILHLVDDRKTVMERVHQMLKADGYFVSSTLCLGDWMSWFRFIVPLLKRTGKIPNVSTFTEKTLVNELKQSGFEIVDQWRPRKKAAVFIIARKPA
ncbi:class I SAM-dependent methyltransferase [Reinekea blandensis]|uniref:SAM-dependent methyltransferase n=1 Tax=Reinekea blandensis MED297 TaxID=314283 RepID=A4BKH6_9GAMM|nr:class I SAM-dependent methyltransferase [Reinekea blandensis]EAR07375.1 SAM-dependent methyltransferase [Reinekea sp. MED297] [Reinekea blandensis MED297]